MEQNTKKKNVMLDTMTGEQFKQLIEQFTHDGKIDTVPELIRVLSDIPEDQTLGEYIAEHGGHIDPEVLKEVVDDAVDEAFDENECSDDDVDSIFDTDKPAGGYDAPMAEEQGD